MYRIAFLTAGALTLLACSDIASEDLHTSGIYADILVSADGSGDSEVSAVLRAGGALSTTFVELTGDDQLTATYKEETKALTQTSLGTLHSFSASFDSADVGTDYLVALERSVDAGAPDTVIQLPEPFELTELEITEFSRSGEDLTIEWTPSGEGDPMYITVDGDCFLLWSEDISGDPGTFTVEAGSLEAVGETATNCEATVSLRRVRSGTLDSGFGEGGSALGQQERELTIQSTP